jgi:hypothetical protein
MTVDTVITDAHGTITSLSCSTVYTPPESTVWRRIYPPIQSSSVDFGVEGGLSFDGAARADATYYHIAKQCAS